jgi:hypothetical protein
LRYHMLFTEERGANQVDLEYGIKMRKYVVICLVTFGLLISNNSAIGQTNYLPDVNAGWLANLNYYRTAAGLNPVTEDKQLSAAVKKHLTYLVMSDPKYSPVHFSILTTKIPPVPITQYKARKVKMNSRAVFQGANQQLSIRGCKDPFMLLASFNKG